MSILSHPVARRLAVALAVGLAAPALQAVSVSAVRESVVKVYATTQRPDYTQPWQSGSPGGGHGSAFIIGKRRILTNAHVISDARFIEVQREGSPRRYEARVVFAGHDCDLAVLTVDDPAFFQGTRPLEFGRVVPDLNNEVIVVGYPMGGTRISLTRGVVSRIDYSPYSHSGVDSHLVLQVDAAINPGNSGGPVLFGGKVVGLAFQGLVSAQNIGYAIPLPVIDHFLTDIDDGRYDGYPELGIAHTDTRNPALRAALGLEEGDGGVAVVYADPFGAAAGHLRPGDVILDVDGHAVADDGSIRIGGNTVEYTELVERQQWGAAMRFTILRDGKRDTLTIPLTNPPDPFIFRYAYDTPPDYLIVGGLVFSPLSRGYLATLGAELSTPSAQHLHYYTQYAKPDGLYTNREQFVVLVTRLPHPLNTYHDAFVQGVVHAVNGRPIGHLADLQAALAAPTNGFHIVEFDGMPNRLVLDAQAAVEADREIAARYSIPALSRVTPLPPMKPSPNRLPFKTEGPVGAALVSARSTGGHKVRPYRTAGLLLVLLLSAAGALAAPLDQSMVEILVTVRRPDAGIPWRRERPRQQDGYGVVVGPGRVLTTEDLVRNATLVELRRAGDGRRITATVVQSDPQADLALLQFSDSAATAGLTPLAIATNGSREGKVTVAKFDEAGQVQTAEGTITDAALRVLPNAPWPCLQLGVQNDLHLASHGAPVVRDGELTALIIDYDEDNSASLALPARLLRRFVADVATPPYLGLPSAGFTWTALLAPDTRRYLGMPEDARGVLVLQTVPRSGAHGVLLPQDVIQEWDGFAIDSEGYYQDPIWGRLLFANLISTQRDPGETVPVRILREGRAQTVSVPLRARADEDAYIPENAAEAPAEYLVEAGLVLRELSADALRAAGARWLTAVNPRSARLYLTRAQFPEQPGDRVVTLVGVLPDPINVGYQHLRDMFVTAVNGKPVRNLGEVFDIVEKDGGIERLALQNYGVDVILDRAQLEAANRRIQAAYNIPRLRYRRPQ